MGTFAIYWREPRSPTEPDQKLIEQMAHLAAVARARGTATPRRRRDLPDVERQTIEQALHETGWNKSKAARRLGITRTQLYGRLRKYGLQMLASGRPYATVDKGQE